MDNAKILETIEFDAPFGAWRIEIRNGLIARDGEKETYDVLIRWVDQKDLENKGTPEYHLRLTIDRHLFNHPKGRPALELALTEWLHAHFYPQEPFALEVKR